MDNTNIDKERLSIINRAIQKAYAVCQNFDKIMVSISGGKDSDIMLDLLLRVCPKEKLHFIFFDTGIEFAATKEHLDLLEIKYGITIERQCADIPVPLGCKKFGLPFISKEISEMIYRLQLHNFDFANDGNKSYSELIQKYPRCQTALLWWCNEKPNSRFNISRTSFLKEFMIATPPRFRISQRCCEGAKKRPSHRIEKAGNYDLKCLGLRKSEGGIRSTNIKNCYSFNPLKTSQNFRPLWWFDNDTEQLYITMYGVELSNCYTKYGMARTGCAGCPYNSNFEEDLLILKEHEPKLYKAVCNVFGESHEYTRQYRKFRDEHKRSKKNING